MRREEQLATLKSVFDESQIEALMTAFGAEKITKDKVDEAFDKFCQWYPKRDGTDPRKPAYEKFRKICSSGTDPDALAHTAKRYYEHCTRKQLINTTYVMQRTTFLTPAAGRYEEFLPQGEEHKWELKPKYDADHEFSNSAKDAWERICRRLCAEFGEPTYRAWFDKLELFEVRDASVVLKAVSKFTADYVSQHWGSRLCELWGCPVRVVA